MSLRTLLHPSWYQGRKKHAPYFEGWYFKMALNDTNETVLALIPGVSITSDDRHAFIQVISSIANKSWYIRYPFEEFHAHTHAFDISVGPNRFSLDGISVDIDSDDLHIHGKVNHLNPLVFPVSLFTPGIMGWYAYVPFMECFHGVVSLHHDVSGTIELNGNMTDWSGGSGYIEKDWGTSFPSAWIWLQSNSFPSKQVSCMLSVARIPFIGRTFTGFLGFVSIGTRLIRFATYTHATLTHVQTSLQDCRVLITTKNESIEFLAKLGDASHLTAPRQGAMERTITESITGTITLSIYDATGKLIFNETGSMAGIELSEAQSLSVQ